MLLQDIIGLIDESQSEKHIMRIGTHYQNKLFIEEIQLVHLLMAMASFQVNCCFAFHFIIITNVKLNIL